MIIRKVLVRISEKTVTVGLIRDSVIQSGGPHDSQKVAIVCYSDKWPGEQNISDDTYTCQHGKPFDGKKLFHG